MDESDLERAVAAFGLDEHLAFLLSVARPSVVIEPVGPQTRPGESKIGGTPDLPVEFAWPTHSTGLCKFIGQFDLSDPAFRPFRLPPGGLLSFFFTADADGYQHWGDGDFVRVFHFADPGKLRPVT